jgi:ABC-type multidrug transport system fused ATPase/permease subunit
LDIKDGKHVALVGPSSTSKSTLVDLLLRQWGVQDGSITIGDQPLTAFSLDALQTQFAVVSQRSYIFNETVAENIRMGKPGATGAEIEPAANDASLKDWIAATPDGLES